MLKGIATLKTDKVQVSHKKLFFSNLKINIQYFPDKLPTSVTTWFLPSPKGFPNIKSYFTSISRPPPFAF